MPGIRRLLAGILLAVAGTGAAPQLPGHFKSVILGCHSENLADFEGFARRAKQSGATHIPHFGDREASVIPTTN